MVNAYNTGYPQPQQQAGFYNQSPEMPQQKPSSNVPVVGLTLTGGAIGGTVGYLKGRHDIKNGNVSDTFAKEAFNKHVKKNLSSGEKKYFKQVEEMLKKINKVSNPEKFKKLLKDNKLVTERLFGGISMDTIINTVNKENLSNKKNAIKKSLEAQIDYNVSNMKDTIKACWNKDKKAFEQTNGVSKEIFDIIKKTKSNGQWKKALKYGGITAGVFGALGIGYKLMTSNR